MRVALGAPFFVVELGILAISSAALAPTRADDVLFRSVIDDSLLDVTPKPGEVETDAVRTFKRSGLNPYIGQPQAIAEGRSLYEARCQACHLRDGKGRIGPSLVTDEPSYSRALTDVGLFEIIYGGASGSMQPFSLQGLRQDNILKVMAYIRTLKKP